MNPLDVNKEFERTAENLDLQNTTPVENEQNVAEATVGEPDVTAQEKIVEPVTDEVETTLQEEIAITPTEVVAGAVTEEPKTDIQDIAEEPKTETEIEDAEVEKVAETVTKEPKTDVQDITEETETEIESAEAEKVAETVTEEPKTDIQDIAKETEKDEDVSDDTEDYTTMSKEGLYKKLAKIIDKDVNEIKKDVETIKQSFYKIIRAETDVQKQQFIEKGGNEKDFLPKKDQLEGAMKNLLSQYKTKRAEQNAKTEREKEENLVQKQHILEQMKALVEINEDVSSHIGEFKNLQQKWKSIGAVPSEASGDLHKQYGNYQDSFWDLIKINNELREYDFRKNLEAKTALCEAAEKLITEEHNIVEAFRKLQKLHEDWHEIGPVARDRREAIWARFKEATLVINKRHQIFFDERRKNEEKGLAEKKAICEKIATFDCSQLKTFKDWDEATEIIKGWQHEWHSKSFASRKTNQKVFAKYRAACEKFFGAKEIFYKEVKKEQNENLAKKRALLEQAEALKNSVDWKPVSDKLIKLQKEWKTIGLVPKRHSEELWKKFIAACDHFFEERNRSIEGHKNAEQDNLNKKKALIERINAFEKIGSESESLAALRELSKEWSEIGYVPFKDKDSIYKEYKDALDRQFDRLNIAAASRRLDIFRENLKDMTTRGEGKLYRERDKLVRVYENLKSELNTYENNIGFFTSMSKKGGGMIKEMEQKIESLKEELALVEQKITLLDRELRSH
ncbi:MAG: DUF349 domain-containing protein [Prevotellaceae bacterium]|nr:DUF349 domain-containing protein [Prevotellaceae bacterium]